MKGWAVPIFLSAQRKICVQAILSWVIYRKDNKQYWMSCNAGYGVYVYDNNFNYLRSVAIENNAADRRLRNIVRMLRELSGSFQKISLSCIIMTK